MARSSVDTRRFANLMKKAEKLNKEIKFKRFYPIEARDGKVLVFGLYDYVSKKQIYSVPFQDANEVFDEIEVYLNKVQKELA